MTIQDAIEFNEIVEKLKNDKDILIMSLPNEAEYHTDDGKIVKSYEKLSVFCMYDTFPFCIRKSDDELRYGRWMYADFEYQNPYQLRQYMVWRKFTDIDEIIKHLYAPVDITKKSNLRLFIKRNSVIPEQIQPEIGEKEAAIIRDLLQKNGVETLSRTQYYLKSPFWTDDNREVSVLSEEVGTGRRNLYKVNMDTGEVDEVVL